MRRQRQWQRCEHGAFGRACLVSDVSDVTAAPSAGAHNDADVMFAQHMIPHHQQAVEMSDIVLAKQGIDPRVTELATAIKAAQGPEIKQMQEWLGAVGQPTCRP